VNRRTIPSGDRDLGVAGIRLSWPARLLPMFERRDDMKRRYQVSHSIDCGADCRWLWAQGRSCGGPWASRPSADCCSVNCCRSIRPGHAKSMCFQHCWMRLESGILAHGLGHRESFSCSPRSHAGFEKFGAELSKAGTDNKQFAELTSCRSGGNDSPKIRTASARWGGM
jgi:hypothetical protein